MTKEEFNQLREEVMRAGGTGSNMAETPYVPPGPTDIIPDNLPPEEKERRRKGLIGIREMVRLAGIHVMEMEKRKKKIETNDSKTPAM